MKQKIKQLSVYLSKSNLIDNALVDVVRTQLENDGLKVLEYRGGAYSTKPIAEADFMLVICENVQVKSTPSGQYEIQYTFGKGQFNEVYNTSKRTLFLDVNYIPTMEVTKGAQSSMVLDEGEWKRNYGVISHIPRTTPWTLPYLYQVQDMLEERYLKSNSNFGFGRIRRMLLLLNE